MRPAGCPAARAAQNTILAAGAQFATLSALTMSAHPLVPTPTHRRIPLAGLILARAQTEAHTAERAFESAVDNLAGYDVKTKGERAVQDARAGLAAQFDAVIVDYRDSVVSSRLARLAEPAAQAGVTLHHLALDARALTASGTAASVDKAEEFIRLLGDAGFRAVMSEAPKTGPDGSVQFFLHTPQP